MKDKLGKLGKDLDESIEEKKSIGVEIAKQTAKKAAAEQAALLAKQEKEIQTKELEREERLKRKRVGRGSLLYQGTDERGVSSTLGGQ